MDGHGGYFGGSPYGSNHYNPGLFFNGDGPAPTELSNGDFAKFSAINWGKAANARIAHAALASSAFVFLFPMGAIAMRVLPGRLALIIHGIFQLFAYIIFTAAVGLGIWIAVTVRFSGFDFVCLSRFTDLASSV